MLRPIAPPLLGDVARRAPAVGDCGEPAADVAHAPFPPELRELESFECIAGRREDYVGPTDESNWVLPGKLMVGAFPGVADDDENERLLTSILEMGITTFVCLQREYEPDAPEIAWRTGQAIRPYFTSAVNVAAQLDASSAEAPPRKLAFIHFGIVDCATVEDDAVLRFVRALALRLRNAAEVVYLHCWGGHGRTGTVVCLLLYLLYGLDARQALHRCQFVHDLRRVPIAVGSPQTSAQREQVVRIIDTLIQRDREAAQRAAAHAAAASSQPKAAQPKAAAQTALPTLPGSSSKGDGCAAQDENAIGRANAQPAAQGANKAPEEVRPGSGASVGSNGSLGRGSKSSHGSGRRGANARRRTTAPPTAPPSRKPAPGRRFVAAPAAPAAAPAAGVVHAAGVAHAAAPHDPAPLRPTGAPPAAAAPAFKRVVV